MKTKISQSNWGQDERIFISQLFEDQAFIPELNSAEQWAWKAFKNVSRNFIGNEKAENYSEIVRELTSSHGAKVCNMSLVLHFLYSHLDFFPEISESHLQWTWWNVPSYYFLNWKAVQWKMVSSMLPDYCCSLIWVTPAGECKRQNKTKWVLNEFFSD